MGLRDQIKRGSNNLMGTGFVGNVLAMRLGLGGQSRNTELPYFPHSSLVVSRVKECLHGARKPKAEKGKESALRPRRECAMKCSPKLGLNAPSPCSDHCGEGCPSALNSGQMCPSSRVLSP